MDGPEARRIAAAARAVSPEEPVLLPTLGGSLPWHVFDDRLEAPIVGVPIANHDNNQHGPDENLRVANLWYGIDLVAEIVGGVDEAPPAVDPPDRATPE